MFLSSRWKFLIFISSFFIISEQQDISEEIKNASEHIIPKNYLKHTIPTSNGEPLQVNLSMRIFVISSVNFDDMDFSVDMYLKQEWQDKRIRVPEDMFEYGDDHFNLPYQIFDYLWQPDICFLNSKMEEKTTTHKHSSYLLFKNQTIRFVSRLHAVIACPMEFYNFPMDTQICPIVIESFSYTNNKIILKWAGQGVILDQGLKHIQYNILPLHLERNNIFTAEKSGNYSRLVVYIAFERQIGHAVIQIFAPSTLIVVLSWFSFWLDLDAVPGRVTLLVTCMLTLVTMFTDLRVETPLVDYVKALDIWMAGCMLLVFGAVAEFIIAKVLYGKYNNLKKKEEKARTVKYRASDASDFMDPNSLQYVHDFQYHTASKNKSVFSLYWLTSKGSERILWKQCDKISRFVFPIIFFVFSVIYWTIMIYGRERHRRDLELI